MSANVACFFVAALSLFASVSAADSKSNPADELVSVLNANRTTHKSSVLFNNPGLGCIALQYIKAYQGQCGDVGGSKGKKPADSEFTDTFAPNCNVEASTLSPITGRLLGCQTKYVQPNEAFSDILIHNDKSLEILYSKNHTEVGAAVSGSDGGSPYFWCVLFSNGKTNSSFSLSGGVVKTQHPGCYSGNNDDCSGAVVSHVVIAWTLFAGALIAVVCVFGL
ncbi:hypothetical protein QJS10_CPA09g00118 [Acorus calamus]|uniref:Ferredoxin-like protein n=1 Tax=Acorus calamus TaxID=4465 RepID=A0AAV9E7N5_ACOCL|nr:hypothetical protein QJS10_CPA09g00118 [Acorus calamus]